MRLHYGAIPESKETPPQDWHRAKELSIFWLTVIGALVGLMSAAIVLYLWLWAKPFAEMTRIEPMVLWLSVALIAIVPLHELLHAVVYPKFGLSNETVIGAWPAKMLCYAMYDGKLSRNRLLAVMVMPFLVLTVLPLAWAMVTGQASHVLMFVSVMNTIFAGGDIVNTFLILFGLPCRSEIRTYGIKTYWHVTG